MQEHNKNILRNYYGRGETVFGRIFNLGFSPTFLENDLLTAAITISDTIFDVSYECRMGEAKYSHLSIALASVKCGGAVFSVKKTHIFKNDPKISRY